MAVEESKESAASEIIDPKFTSGSFEGGLIWVELQSGICSFVPGSTVKGKIHVHQWAEFASNQLTLAIIGTERGMSETLT